MSITSSPSVAARLEQVCTKLERVREAIRTEYVPESYKGDSDLRNIVLRGHEDLSQAADLVRRFTCKLRRDHQKIISLSPAYSRNCSKRTFHVFRRLPIELRLLIWEAAVQAPPCKHFLTARTVELEDQFPTASYIGDQGLWTACRESRMATRNYYRRLSLHVEKTGCIFRNMDVERHHRRLGNFNRDGELLKKALARLDERFRSDFYKISFLSGTLEELYVTRPTTMWTNYGSAILTDEEICEELQGSTLFINFGDDFKN